MCFWNYPEIRILCLDFRVLKLVKKHKNEWKPIRKYPECHFAPTVIFAIYNRRILFKLLTRLPYNIPLWRFLDLSQYSHLKLRFSGFETFKNIDKIP